MTAKRFRVNDLVKYNYSEIGEYIDENHTDRPLRNDEVVELLNELTEENEELKTIISNHMGCIDKLYIENEKLKKNLEHCANMFTDNGGKNLYWTVEYVQIVKLVELLNELHEENNVLKQELKTKAVVNRQYEELQTFKKENEQLKKECYGNLDGLNYYQEQNGHLSSKISDLECENEQLKHFKEISDNITKEVEDFFEKHEFDTVNFNVLDEVFDDVDYYYEKCIRLNKENEQLKHRLAISEKANFVTALEKENGQLKAQLKDCEKRVTDKEVEWLRNNTVWEQMPSNKRTFITTSAKEDYK